VLCVFFAVGGVVVDPCDSSGLVVLAAHGVLAFLS
jgi:hypothetical protein